MLAGGRIGCENERKGTGSSEGRSSELEADEEYDERAAALWAVYVQEAEVRDLCYIPNNF